MGASGWQYFVPYQEDVNQALQDLRQQVFDDGDYYWYGEDEVFPPEARIPRPERMDDLYMDDGVQDSGTHSILDVVEVVSAELPRDWHAAGTVIPATADEVREATGTDRPIRADAEKLEAELDQARWVGRCAVLYDEQGVPAELMFFGYSGD